MRANVIQIGNSRGIRIPKSLLEQTGLQGEVELEVRGEQLVIRPVNPRAGWADAFRSMAARADDGLLDPEAPTGWDGSEWRW
jgi:antitoxin MazE